MLESIWLIPLSVVVSWFATHVIKEIIHLAENKNFSWYTLLFETGGMPSSHSATVTALATSVFLLQGFSVSFWIALLFALVVLRDAIGVRKNVGDQAEIIKILLKHTNIKKKLDVVLGHTPIQVGVGALLGIGITLIVWYPW